MNSFSKTEDTASDSLEAAKNASNKKGKKYIVVGNITEVEQAFTVKTEDVFTAESKTTVFRLTVHFLMFSMFIAAKTRVKAVFLYVL